LERNIYYWEELEKEVAEVKIHDEKYLADSLGG